MKQCGVNVSLNPNTSQVIFSGGGFGSASEVLSSEQKSQKKMRCSPQGSPRCPATSYQDGAPKLLGP